MFQELPETLCKLESRIDVGFTETLSRSSNIVPLYKLLCHYVFDECMGHPDLRSNGTAFKVIRSSYCFNYSLPKLIIRHGGISACLKDAVTSIVGLQDQNKSDSCGYVLKPSRICRKNLFEGSIYCICYRGGTIHTHGSRQVVKDDGSLLVGEVDGLSTFQLELNL